MKIFYKTFLKRKLQEAINIASFEKYKHHSHLDTIWVEIPCLLETGNNFF